jgi:hypothetical protein
MNCSRWRYGAGLSEVSEKIPKYVTEIFIKVMRKFEASAKTRLQQYHVAHADALEGLIGQFRDILQIPQNEGIPERRMLAIIRESLGSAWSWEASPS